MKASNNLIKLLKQYSKDCTIGFNIGNFVYKIDNNNNITIDEYVEGYGFNKISINSDTYNHAIQLGNEQAEQITVINPDVLFKTYCIRWTPHREYGLSVSIINMDTKKKVAYATGGGYDKLQDALMQFFDKFLHMNQEQRRNIERQCEGWYDKEHKIEELFKELGYYDSSSDVLRNWNGKAVKNSYFFKVRP